MLSLLVGQRLHSSMRDYASGADHRWFRFENASFAKGRTTCALVGSREHSALEPGMDSNGKINDLRERKFTKPFVFNAIFRGSPAWRRFEPFVAKQALRGARWPDYESP
jgi:hypothetical protein